MTIPLFALALILQAVPAGAPPAPPQSSQPRRVASVLHFPEAGLDDTAAYQGYKTRLYRDSRGNTVQIYLGPHDGRVVLLWADALDESAAFTVRDARGRAAPLDWSGDSATVADSGGTRRITYELDAATPNVTLGWFLLGTMRVERDFQYAHAHLRQFGAPPYVIAPESALVANIARLPTAEQQRELALLAAHSVAELRARRSPVPVVLRSGSAWTVRLDHPALDGRSHLRLEVMGDARQADARIIGRTVSIRSRSGRSVHLTIQVSTDGAALTPLTRDEIFNAAFLSYLAHATTGTDSAVVTHARRLEREVLSVELLSSREKLMAGLPNFATYFGRDGLMTALMMRAIWTPVMSERVIASVLGKLGPAGDVSHEEALGEQAIRESAAVYDSLIGEYFRLVQRADSARADSSLAAARAVLHDLRRTRENYHMMDDEFQLPVLEARYLADSTVPGPQKRAFLFDSTNAGTSHLALVLREMALVASETQPYARNPVATSLIGFVKRDSTHWQSASWRDSNAGYANGRFAMDINAIWAPCALRSIAGILASLHALGLSNDALDSIAPGIAHSALGDWMRDSTSLEAATATWQGARRWFTVTLDPSTTRRDIRAKLAWLPSAERQYWERIMNQAHEVRDSVVFLALSLDAKGQPIQVVNTDPATDLFLTDHTRRIRTGAEQPGEVLQEVQPFMRVYPVGLFVSGLGPVVANDAYASRSVWDAFRDDAYHSPRVVWGREVNLFLLGVTDQIASAYDTSGSLADPALASYVQALREALERMRTAVTASHLEHNELWSYQIRNGRLLPMRYGTSSDVQLWSTTDLAVQFALSRLPR
ncbi:MAG: hypothetical protein ACREOJ_05700 [Gemmatimonadaceae bacterium]